MQKKGSHAHIPKPKKRSFKRSKRLPSPSSVDEDSKASSNHERQKLQRKSSKHKKNLQGKLLRNPENIRQALSLHHQAQNQNPILNR